MFALENDLLKVNIRTKGAELDSLFNKKGQLEYMWSGDPAVWGKKSPVLFPIVGSLKDDTYFYEDKTYHLPRHGFARDMEFVVTRQTDQSLTFTLLDNETTLQKFPFSFRFDVIYTLELNQLKVAYKVTNTGKKLMRFSVGGHPAFRLPLSEGSTYEEYYLEFSQMEVAGRWPISKDGLIETAPELLMNYSDRLPLTKDLFYKDAIVFKDLRSNKVRLLSDSSIDGFEFNFSGFPYLGIWAAKNADFICIEPWCGIADSVNTDQQLQHKEGTQSLPAGEQFERAWSVTVF